MQIRVAENMALWATHNRPAAASSSEPVDKLVPSEKPVELYKPDGQSSLKCDCVIQSFSWTPQGQVISAEWPNLVGDVAPIRVWDAGGSQERRLQVTQETVRPGPLAVSPDGQTVAIGWENGKFSLHSIQGPELAILEHCPEVVPPKSGSYVDNDSVTGIAYSPDGKQLATAGMDGQIHLWDTTTRTKIGSLKNPDWTTDLEFTPDGTRLASRFKGGVAVWDLATRSPVQTFTEEGNGFGGGMTLSPDGKRVAAVMAEGVKAWDLESGAELGCQPIRGAHKLSFAGNGHVLVGEAIHNAVHDWDLSARTVTRRELPYERPLGALKAEGIRGIRVSPDGQQMAISLMDYNLTLWTRDARESDLGHMVDHLKRPDNPQVKEVGGFVYVGSVRVPKKR